ncbi:MAG: hypothetical protein ACRD9R_11955 [Pyrinomonadaceae bacterium]
MKRSRCGRRAFRAVALLLGVLSAACAAGTRPPDPSRPRVSEPPYPITLGASTDRREQALAAWDALAVPGIANVGPDASTRPELQPVTATVRALPAGATLQLPSVEPAGESADAAQEAERESLRRFLLSAPSLVGVQLPDLSLVEVKEVGTLRRALYRQRPFPYPLRGGYGEIEIAFTPERRVAMLSSTAIPDTEQRLTRALAAPRTLLTAAETRSLLASGRTFSYTDADGRTQTYAPAAAGPVNVRELVIYPLRMATDLNTLELHIAWEIEVGEPARLRVYLDAVTGEVVSVETAAPL